MYVRLISTAEHGPRAFLFCFVFFKNGFLCVIEPRLSWTHFIDQAGLRTHSDLSASASGLGHHTQL